MIERDDQEEDDILEQEWDEAEWNEYESTQLITRADLGIGPYGG